MHSKSGVQSEGWEAPNSLLAHIIAPMAGQGARGQAGLAAVYPAVCPAVSLVAGFQGRNLARPALPRGQAVPACVFLCPGPGPAASQRHQVHGRVEPKVRAGPRPLSGELGASIAKISKLVAKPLFQRVLVPELCRALPGRRSHPRLAAGEGRASLCRAPIPAAPLPLGVKG